MKIIVQVASILMSASALLCAQQNRPEPSVGVFPEATVALTRRLEFYTAAPSPSGSLREQVERALDELVRKANGARLVKLRVFAVGAENLIAARDILASALSAKHMTFPVLSLVGAAAFPKEGQQVQIEAVAAGANDTNPNGIAFLAGLASPTGDRTIAGLAKVVTEAGITVGDVLRISCFYESPEQAGSAAQAVAATFPAAQVSIVKSFVPAANPAVECEGIARLHAAPGAGVGYSTLPGVQPSSDDVRYFNLPGIQASPNFSRAALVPAPNELVFTGTQIAFGDSAADMRDVLDHAKRAVESLGGGLARVVMGDNYWLTADARDRLRETRPIYFGATVPAATGVFFTGLAAPNGRVAIELVVALSRREKAQ